MGSCIDFYGIREIAARSRLGSPRTGAEVRTISAGICTRDLAHATKQQHAVELFCLPPAPGEIDHYKLLMPVIRTGLTIPLVCENIFEPLTPRPSNPETIDTLERRAREYLEAVIRGLEHSN